MKYGLLILLFSPPILGAPTEGGLRAEVERCVGQVAEFDGKWRDGWASALGGGLPSLGRGARWYASFGATPPFESEEMPAPLASTHLLSNALVQCEQFLHQYRDLGGRWKAFLWALGAFLLVLTTRIIQAIVGRNSRGSSDGPTRHASSSPPPPVALGR